MSKVLTIDEILGAETLGELSSICAGRVEPKFLTPRIVEHRTKLACRVLMLDSTRMPYPDLPFFESTYLVDWASDPITALRFYEADNWPVEHPMEPGSRWLLKEFGEARLQRAIDEYEIAKPWLRKWELVNLSRTFQAIRNHDNILYGSYRETSRIQVRKQPASYTTDDAVMQLVRDAYLEDLEGSIGDLYTSGVKFKNHMQPFAIRDVFDPTHSALRLEALLSVYRFGGCYLGKPEVGWWYA